MSNLAVPTAVADSDSLKDANDVDGRLDIKKIAFGHKGERFKHAITTRRPFDDRDLRVKKERYFAFIFDTDGDFFVDYYVFVYSNGRYTGLLGVLTDADGEVIDTVGTRRPDEQSVRILLDPSDLGTPRGYHWSAISYFKKKGDCKKTCIDAAPDDTSSLHDFTEPSIDVSNFPALSTDVSAGLTFPLTFEIADRGFSGVAAWQLFVREYGSTEWIEAAEGSTEGVTTASVTAPHDGIEYEVRLRTTDREGNTCDSDESPSTLIPPVIVPLDDASFLPGSFTGSWTVSGQEDDYRGTLHETSEVGASFTVPIEGWRAYLIAKGSDGVLRMSVDGGTAGVVDLSQFEGRHRATVWEWANYYDHGSHTVTGVVLEGSVAIDALGYGAGPISGVPPPDPCVMRFPKRPPD